MAARFRPPESDVDEKQARVGAIPLKTEGCTEWGIKAWNDLAAARVTTVFCISQLVSLTSTVGHYLTTALAFLGMVLSQ